MTIPRPVPSSFRQAWQWAASTIERGLSGAEGLRQYREGGGAIRTQWWYESLRSIGAAVEAGERMSTIPAPLQVPGLIFEMAPAQTREHYYVNAFISGWDPETGQVISQYVTAESSDLMTANEWDAALMAAATWGAGGTKIERPIIRDRKPFQRATA